MFRKTKPVVAATPDDWSLQLGLDSLWSIHAESFQAPPPEPAAPVFTVCFWFMALTAGHIQVMVNSGHRRADEAGWSCFLHSGQVVVSLSCADGRQTAVAYPFPEDGRWHHVTAVIDDERAAIEAAFDGVPAGWRLSKLSLHPAAPPGGHPGLTVGGYTDAAGGHFSYAFGRAGTGMIDDLRVYRRALTTDEIAAFAPRPGSPPDAQLTWQAPHREAPVRVCFDASSAMPPNPILACLWDWEDGSRELGSTVERDFAYAGAYRIQLTVVDANHRQSTTVQTIVLDGPENPLRITPVFVNGADGYAAYRIPSIVRALNGDLVAFAEGRVESASDSTATIRIVSKISCDHGHTWGPLQVVARNIVAGVEYAAMNPSPVVDTVRGTGRLVLVFKKLEHSEWEIAKGHGVMRTFSIVSDDHGRSWHDERDITAQVQRPHNSENLPTRPGTARLDSRDSAWRIQVPTLGHAIQLRGAPSNPATRGRLLHVGSRTTAGDSVFASMNYAFWSDNLGESWQIGAFITVRWDSSSARGLNEATVVELVDGKILVNSRNYQHEQRVGCRAVTRGQFDRSGALVFGPVRHDPLLIEPTVQASMLRYSWPEQVETGSCSRILFANPAHPRARANMTVRLSYDEGATWPIAKVVDPGPAAYSDLVVQADQRIGLLYECGATAGIAFANFTLDWLTDGQDSLPASCSGAHSSTPTFGTVEKNHHASSI